MTANLSKPEFTWPKPYLLELYQRAVEEGCIRVVLRGDTDSKRDVEYRSLKAAFYRLRRKKDGNETLVVHHHQFSMVTIRYERATGRALLIYSKLPDDQLLPAIESVKETVDLPQPTGALHSPKPTPESVPDEDFDAQAHVAGMVGKLQIDNDEEEELSDGPE